MGCGQTCVAPDYVLVPAARATTFAQALIEEARRGYPSIANDDYTSIIDERHQARLNAAIDEAAAAGAVIIRHGGEHAGTRKIAPTVVLGAPAGSLLLREEIFGPVLLRVG
jgi:coniferyl-aldehyde dehydrogenase